MQMQVNAGRHDVLDILQIFDLNSQKKETRGKS